MPQRTGSWSVSTSTGFPSNRPFANGESWHPSCSSLSRPFRSSLPPFPARSPASSGAGGYLFGEWLGLLYSTIGLTLGSVAAFGVGRWLGAHHVRTLVSQDTWDRMGFIIEAERAILCFIIYLIPGLPKDMVCYLFGISPMPLWVFALVSTLGRLPGTWVLSAQGALTATGNYLQVILLTAIMVAAALPLYYYRHRIVGWFRGRLKTEDLG